MYRRTKSKQDEPYIIIEIYVGNIFYNQGLATITNEEYLCFADTEPVAKNDYYELGNTQEIKILDILSNDFDDCSTINTSSISLITNPDYTFPDNSIVEETVELAFVYLSILQPVKSTEDDPPLYSSI